MRAACLSARLCATRTRPSTRASNVQVLTSSLSTHTSVNHKAPLHSRLQLTSFVGHQRIISFRLSGRDRRLPQGPAVVRTTVSEAGVDFQAHSDYFRETAAMEPPGLLPSLMRVLSAQGSKLVPPQDRKGTHPLLLPLAQAEGGELVGMLRWPEATSGESLPIVQAGPDGLSLLAPTVEQYITRALVQEEIALGGSGPVREAVGEEAAEGMYPLGGGAQGQPRPEVFLVTKVGKFPDAMEKLVDAHKKKGDNESALITAEWMQGHMAEWGYGCAYVSNLMKELGRMDEARDQARVALCSPWWTLGFPFWDVANTAQFEGKELAEIREGIMGEVAVKQAQMQGNLPGTDAPTPEEIALDEAKAMMDFAHVSGNWEDVNEKLVAKFQEAGMNKVAFFVAKAN